MKKKLICSISIIFSFFMFFEGTSYADSVQASDIDELMELFNTSTEDRTITLSDTFPTGITKTIKLKENTNHVITIDGADKVLTPAGAGLILSYYNGSSTTGGSAILKNISFQGDGANMRALDIDGHKGIFSLENVTISDFHAGLDGGAMYIGGTTTIKNSTFQNNSSNSSGYSGGAIGGKGFSGDLTIENSKFENNKTLALGTGPVGGEGGALYFYNPSETASFHFSNNYFKGNSAVENATGAKATLADGGAIALFNVLPGVDIQFKGNTFANNIAGDNGGAVLIQTNETIHEGIVFENNTFYKNSALGTTTPTQSGGAIQIYANGGRSTFRKTFVDFINNTFVANEAKTRGGAIGLAGAPFFNASGGRFTNNIFVDNLSENELYNSVASSGTTQKDENNIGLDVGKLNTVSAEDVFGTLPYELVENYNSITAGSVNTQEIIPTLPIAPEKEADGKVAVEETLSMDQRNIKRIAPSDIGSVEISWIKYDSNGGTFTFSSLPSLYEGSEYYETLEPTTYYQIGVNPSKKTIPSGVVDLGLKRDGWTFQGWSLKKDATTPDSDLAENKEVDLQNDHENKLYNGTVYAVWKENPISGGDVTVQYQDEDGNMVSADVTKSGNVGENYTTEELAIDGYTFKEVKGDPAGTFTEDPQSVTYVYTKNPISGGDVTVQYQDEEGNMISADVTKSGNVGENYTTEELAIDGYTFKEVKGDATGTFTEDPQSVIYVYTKNPISGGDVTVQYQDTEGNTISANITKSGDLGENYTTEELAINGYTFKEVTGNPTGTFTTEPQTVTYVYTKNPVNAGDVTVQYQDEEGNTISANITKSGDLGENYTTEELAIDGYTFKEVKGNPTGTFTEDPQSVTYVYTKNPVSAGEVTVQYQDEEGNTISANITKSGNVGENYTTEELAIDGYTFKEVNGNPTGTFTSAPQTVTYVYTKNPISTGDVTVQYQDEEGNMISADVTKSGNVGENYTTEELAIDGYTFKEVKGDATGTFTSEPQTVTYVYTKNPVNAGDVTVHYQDKDGNKISADVTKSGNVGEKYTTKELTINGYTFKEVKGNPTGNFTEDPQTVTYVYTKNPVNAGDVIVHYQDKDGNKISADVTKSGNVGEKYTTEELTINGYTFKEVKGNPTGTFTEDPQSVTYVYTKIVSNTKKPGNKNGKGTDQAVGKRLPQTGESINPLLVVLGGSILLVSLYTFNRKRMKNS